jgi:predicted GIY-YIG superfamily endonuclease
LAAYTEQRLPVELVYSSEFATRDETYASERQIKGWSRKKKEALMRADWDELRRLARGSDREDPLDKLRVSGINTSL